MATRRLSVVLDLDTGRYSGRLSQAGSQMRTFGGTVNRSSTAVRQLGSSFNSLNSHMSTPLQRLRDYVLILGNLRLAILNVRDIAVGWVGSMLRQSAEVERLTVLMRGLSTATTEAGRSQDANNNLRMLFQLARQSGFAVDALADSFVKMRAGGITNTEHSLRSLTDAVAQFGGTSDIMHRASIAIQQMAGKGVISMEELRQQLGEAVPTAMYDMAVAVGMSLQQFTKLVSDGVVQARPALELMFREFDILYAGASSRMAETLNGQIAQFKTNLMELATSFTGLGDTQGGLFAGATNSLKQLNQAMRSGEARQFVADIGRVANTVLQSLMSIGGFVVRWRSEIGAVIQGIIAGFIAMKATQMARWFFDLGAAGVTWLRNLQLQTLATQGAMGSFANSLASTATSYQRLINIQGLRLQRTREEVASTAQLISAGTRKVQGLQNERASLMQTIAMEERRVSGYQRSVAALRAEVLGGNNSIIMRNRLQMAIRAEQAASDRLTAAKERLVLVDRGLVVTEAQVATAANMNTAAMAREGVAARATTVALRVKAAAAEAATLAARGLAVAVNLVLGPLGLIAIALYEAANAAGVFENRADRAAEAAARLRSGLADLNAAQTLSDEQRRLRAEHNGDAQILRQGGYYQTSYAHGREFRRLTPQQEAAIRQRMQSRMGQFNQNANALRDYQRSVRRDRVNEVTGRFDQQYEERRATNGQAYSTFRRQQQGLLDSGQIDQRTFTSRVDAFRGRVTDNNRAFRNAQIAQLEQYRGAAARRGQDVTVYDMELQHLRETQDETAASAEELRGQLVGTGTGARGAGHHLTEAEKSARRAATAFDNARERYADMIANQSGDIAELSAQAQGGEGALAQFEAKVRNGLYDDALPAEVERLRDGFRQIDQLNEQLDFNRTFGRLGRDLAEANTNATGLWRSVIGGTFDVDQRLNQIRSQFAGVLDGLTDPEKIAQVNARVEEIVTALQRADSAETVNSWRDMTLEIQRGLEDERLARDDAMNAEIERQRNLVAWEKLSLEERTEAQRRFYAWETAMRQRNARDNEHAIVKMARDWAKLGTNIEGAMTGWVNSFVDGLFDAEFSFKDFVKGMLKQLLKIIIQALIAYAILSALGMANNSSGQPVSLGDFMKGQISSGFGMGGGADTSIGHPAATVGSNHTGGLMGSGAAMTVSAAIFRRAREFHNGGWIGGRQLRAGEVPIIGKENELVLTEQQQQILGRRLAGAGQAPAIALNIINNSGTDVDAEVGQPEFNGQEWVLNVVMDAMSKQTPLRQLTEKVGGGGR